MSIASLCTKYVLGQNFRNEPTIPQSALLMVRGVLGQKLRNVTGLTTAIPQIALYMARRQLSRFFSQTALLMKSLLAPSFHPTARGH